MERVTIRRMSPADLPQVFTIENDSFSAPWSLNSFQYELENNEAFFLVAAIEEQIAGYICLRTMLNVTHVMNLAVERKLRHRGIGSMLLQSALEELRRIRPDIKFITLEVRESSEAVRLYEKAGFSVIGRQKGYYSSPEEDAVIMGLEIAD